MDWIFRGNMRNSVPMEKNAKFVVSDAILDEVKHYMELCGTQRAKRGLGLARSKTASNIGGSEQGSGGVTQRSSVDYSWLATAPNANARGRSVSLVPSYEGSSFSGTIPESDVTDPITASELPYMTELERAELEDLALKVQPDEYVRTVKLFRRKLATLASYRSSEGRRSDGFDQSEALIVPGPGQSSRRSSKLPLLPDECSSNSSTSSITGMEIGAGQASSSSESRPSLRTPPTSPVGDADINLEYIKPREIPNVMRLTIYNILDARQQQHQQGSKKVKKANKIMPSSSQEPSNVDSLGSTLNASPGRGAAAAANRKPLGITSTIINVPQNLDTSFPDPNRSQINARVNHEKSTNPRRNTTHNMPV